MLAWSFCGRGRGREKLCTLVELALGWPYSERFGMKGDDLVTVVVLDESDDSLDTDWARERLWLAPSEGKAIGELSEGLLGEEVIV